MTKKKKIAVSIASMLSIGVVVTIPILAVNITTSEAVNFDPQKIAVYYEKEWQPAYEKAVDVYNKQGNHKYEIELKEKGAFDVLGLVDTLGALDQKVPDLIYTPLDKVANLVQENQALMGFDTPEQLLEGISTDVTGTTKQELDAYAKKGQAIVKNKNGEDTPYYFGVSHSVEALIMFYKGWDENTLKNSNLKQIFDSANNNGWRNEMASFQFNNMWLSLGVVAGFIENEVPGAGFNGQNVGRALSIFNTLDKPRGFQTNMIKIGDPNNVSNMQQVNEIPGWTEGGIVSPLKETSLGLQKAVDYVGAIYKSSYSRNNPLLGQSVKNDWMIGGNFGKTQTDLFKAATKGIVVDGPWAKDQYKDVANGIIPVPKLDPSGTQFIQAPGGWMYGINQRNFNKPEKIKDMKAFINILLSDESVIIEEYKHASKIIDGHVANQVWTKAYDNKQIDDVDKALIEAVSTSKRMDARPDGGNVQFGDVWTSWDGNGWSSEQMKSLFVGGTNIDASFTNNVRNILIQSFQTMLNLQYSSIKK